MLDEIRKSLRRPVIQLSEGFEKAQACTLDRDITRSQQLSAIFATVEQLSLRQQQIITLRYKVGLTQRAVARDLGISLATVQVDERRALARIRTRLNQ
jgi:RNA polymerase sigma factor (sigma-70 family)